MKLSTGKIDVAVLQSLNRKGVVEDVVAEYGQVIVDECHHLSAFSFEQVLRQVKARYVLGLTATPFRKDGHHPIILMHCGGIRYRVNAREQAATRPFRHLVLPRPTAFRLPPQADKPPIHEIYNALTRDESRNALIVQDVLNAVRRGRSPLILTERIDHLDLFAARLEGSVKNLIVLRGGMWVKHGRHTPEADPGGGRRVHPATDHIGEGLRITPSRDADLEGHSSNSCRLHRMPTKEVIVYDYTDDAVPIRRAYVVDASRGIRCGQGTRG